MAQPQVPDITNAFRRSLERAERPLIGIWLMLNSFNATEGISWAGFDWATIDGEHAPIELPDVVHHLRIFDGSPTAPIVRLAWNDPILLKRHLDVGVTTFMLPFVQTADEARAAVQALHYPPRGIRGMAGMHRANRFGHVPDYYQTASDNMFLVCQIETSQAMDNLEEILAVDGVDSVFFGPSDLSASFGEPGGARGEMVTRLILEARERAAASGKYIGALAADDRQAETFLGAGFHYVNVAVDAALLFSAADSKAAQFRQIATGAGSPQD